MSQSNKISAQDLLGLIAEQERRVKRLYDLIQGVPIGTARIANLAVTNAKIDGLSADKITAGTILVQVGVGTSANGAILIDGVNVRISMFDPDDLRLLIGDDGT